MRKQAPIRVALHLTSRGTWNLERCYSAWPAVILRTLTSSSSRTILCFSSMFSFISSLSTLVSEASSSASASSRFRIYQKPNISALARAVSRPPRNGAPWVKNQACATLTPGAVGNVFQRDSKQPNGGFSSRWTLLGYIQLMYTQRFWDGLFCSSCDVSQGTDRICPDATAATK